MRLQEHPIHRQSSKSGPDGLTDRQRDIRDFIATHVATKGRAPTVREIGERFGIRSPNGVVVNLDALVKKGKITRDADISRGIKIVPTDDEQERIDLIDRIKALPTSELERIVAKFC